MKKDQVLPEMALLKHLPDVYYLNIEYIFRFEDYQAFIAQPHSGINASRMLLIYASSDGSNLPSFLILANKAE